MIVLTNLYLQKPKISKIILEPKGLRGEKFWSRSILYRFNIDNSLVEGSKDRVIRQKYAQNSHLKGSIEHSKLPICKVKEISFKSSSSFWLTQTCCSHTKSYNFQKYLKHQILFYGSYPLIATCEKMLFTTWNLSPISAWSDH